MITDKVFNVYSQQTCHQINSPKIRMFTVQRQRKENKKVETERTTANKKE